MSKEWDNSHDMRILGRIVEVRSTEQSVGINVGAFDPDIIFIHQSHERTIWPI